MPAASAESALLNPRLFKVCPGLPQMTAIRFVGFELEQLILAGRRKECLETGLRDCCVR